MKNRTQEQGQGDEGAADPASDDWSAAAGQRTRRGPKLIVGSGDRSERIRTYNFPQGRVNRHRINLTLHRLPEILEGQLDELVGALIPKISRSAGQSR